MKPKKKDRNYIPILDQPIEELKKPIDKPVDFDKVITEVLSVDAEMIKRQSKDE